MTEDSTTSNSSVKKNLNGGKYDYDFLVIGGGSGGVAAAREARKLGASVCLLDYVRPTPHGTTWGIGGTCLNVGCIPKKLMHTASHYRDVLKDAIAYGWKGYEQEKLSIDWEKLVTGVQDHIFSSNWKYETELRTTEIEYINAQGSFIDAHTVNTKDNFGNEKIITSDKILIAVGGRPQYIDIPGAQLCITSDDLFSLPKPPGKTLVIGASYVALECAGFLKGFSFDVTVMVRSIVLRGFDTECATKIKSAMTENGVKFIQPAVPLSFKKTDNGKIEVTYAENIDDVKDAVEKKDVFDTVLLAAGRLPETKWLALDKAGVKVNSKNMKIIVDDYEKTSTDNIFAIGDVRNGGLELTPVAIQAGKLLADRLFNPKTKNVKLDYTYVPTTVFTPLEYGSCGHSEEGAKEKFGEKNLKIYRKSFSVLEYSIPYREEKPYIKLICLLTENERVIGFHYLGPNAGEITQGVAIAMKLKATKNDFDSTIGIHPTVAETMTKLLYGEEKETGC